MEETLDTVLVETSTNKTVAIAVGVVVVAGLGALAFTRLRKRNVVEAVVEEIDDIVEDEA